MSRIFRYALATLLFWCALFQFFRIIEFIAWRPLWRAAGVANALAAFLRGWRLDLATAAYLSAAPFLLTALTFLFTIKAGLRLARWAVLIEIICYSMIAVGETALYPEWKTKLNMQALEHFSHPSEVFEITPMPLIAGFFIALAALGAFFLWVYHRWVAPKPATASSVAKKNARRDTALSALAAAALLIVFMRGGLSPRPVAESDVYFCDPMVPNDLAVNPAFHLAANFAWYQTRLSENPFRSMPDEKARGLVDSLYFVPKDTSAIFLTIRRPNVVFVVVESLSANCSKSFGGGDFTPYLDSLARQGLLFDQIYPAGWISDQGVPTVLSGLPATSRMSYILHDAKLPGLPCVSQDLKKAGYSTGFIYGGHLEYANFGKYLQAKGFDRIADQKNMPAGLTRARLGVCDADMAGQAVDAMSAARAPFFYAWYTVNSHSPYDLPEPKTRLADFENDYANCVRYADKALGLFFEKAAKQSWYANTLFVVIADHSHGSPQNLPTADKAYHRIPLLFSGPVIEKKWRGKRISRIFSQMDIVPTLLKQFGLEASGYPFGKNMFNPYVREFAPFSFYDGAGFVAPEGFASFKEGKPGIVLGEAKDAAAVQKLGTLARAFRQVVYSDFLRR